MKTFEEIKESISPDAPMGGMTLEEATRCIKRRRKQHKWRNKFVEEYDANTSRSQ